MDGYPPTPPRGPQVPRAPPLRPSRQPPPILRSEEEQRFFDFLQSLPRAPTHRPVITPEMASSMRNSSAPQANRLDLTNELPRAPPPLRPSRPHIIDLINELPRAPTHRPVITPEMAAYIRQQEPRMNNSQRLQLAYDRESQNRLRMLRREAERREAEEREAEREGRRIFQGSAVARREDDDDETNQDDEENSQAGEDDVDVDDEDDENQNREEPDGYSSDNTADGADERRPAPPLQNQDLRFVLNEIHIDEVHQAAFNAFR